MSFIPKNNEIITKAKVREMNALVLAYVGDAVHSLYVRTKLASTTTYKTNKLNSLSINQVNAKAQAKRMLAILDTLSEEELDIFHRARNAHVNNVAKSASLQEYLLATAFEALIGYLYLTGQVARLEEILFEE